MKPVITLDGVTRQTTDGPATKTIIDSITMTINSGQLTVIAGPSGSGKTTPALLNPSAAGYSTDDLMNRLDIAHLAHRRPGELSGGEQQRTAAGRGLRLRPRVLIADEPTAHQDATRAQLLLGLFREHASNGNSVLIASHDDTVIASADRVVTLVDGRIASGPAVERFS